MLDTSLNNLSALYNTLDISLEKETLTKQTFLHRLCFLSQYCGVPLNYSFHWNRTGPWSQDLYSDIYTTYATLQSGSFEELKTVQVHKNFHKNVSKIFSIIAQKPVNLGSEEWVDMVSTFLFLKNDAKYSLEETQQIITNKRRDILPYLSLIQRV